MPDWLWLARWTGDSVIGDGGFLVEPVAESKIEPLICAYAGDPFSGVRLRRETVLVLSWMANHHKARGRLAGEVVVKKNWKPQYAVIWDSFTINRF